MKKLKINTVLTLATVLLLSSGCGSGKNIAKGNEINRSLSLREHLMRKSSVILRGNGTYTKVFIRSMGSASARGSQQPLFVIDGSPVGRNFANAKKTVSGSQITSVKVYTPARAARWGGRGAYGVIVVKTK